MSYGGDCARDLCWEVRTVPPDHGQKLYDVPNKNTGRNDQDFLAGNLVDTKCLVDYDTLRVQVSTHITQRLRVVAAIS